MSERTARNISARSTANRSGQNVINQDGWVTDACPAD
jgi:hypothetical protein